MKQSESDQSSSKPITMLEALEEYSTWSSLSSARGIDFTSTPKEIIVSNQFSPRNRGEDRTPPRVKCSSWFCFARDFVGWKELLVKETTLKKDHQIESRSYFGIEIADDRRNTANSIMIIDWAQLFWELCLCDHFQMRSPIFRTLTKTVVSFFLLCCRCKQVWKSNLDGTSGFVIAPNHVLIFNGRWILRFSGIFPKNE